MSIVAAMHVKPSRDPSHNASINITVPPFVDGDYFCESQPWFWWWYLVILSGIVKAAV